LGYFLV